jgi:hypothetical protein
MQFLGSKWALITGRTFRIRYKWPLLGEIQASVEALFK